MGRRKAKKTAVDTGRLPNEVVEILAALLDVCAVFPSQEVESSDRLTLVSSLDTLAERLSRNELRISSNGETAASWFLQTEATMASIRHETDSFTKSLAFERAEVMFLCQDLQEIVREKANLIAVAHLAQSIAATYRTHVQAEEEMVVNLLHSFDSLYSNAIFSKDSLGDKGSVINRVSEVSRSLVRNDLSLLPKFQAAVLLVNQLTGTDTSHIANNSLVSTFKPKGLPVDLYNDYCDRSHWLGKAQTVYEALGDFLESRSIPTVSSLLLVGHEGCGKTHVCDEIEKMADNAALVFRPRLPIDILGSVVGESEDSLVSLFMAATNRSEPVVVILDDLEHVLEDGSTRSSSTKNASDAPEIHLKTRTQSTLLSMIDYMQRNKIGGSRVLIICSSRNNVGDAIGRFDRTFYLEPPNQDERRRAIVSHLTVEASLDKDNPSVELMLSNLAESMVGRSHAEIAQYCRQAISNAAREENKDASSDETVRTLNALKYQLQSAAPESLRNGTMDEFVDMRVMTARDLGSSSESTEDLSGYVPVLFGSSVESAWKELQASIVIPLCRSRELDDLLCQSDGSTRRVVTSGVLLTGPPGSGKSEIAYHCARYAASLLPSLKLLDVSCTSLIHKEVGGSESAVYHLFQAARKAAPCILIMDGIENIAAVRGNDPTVEGTLDRVLSTLLVELDGVDEHSTSAQPGGVAVIGITHNVNWIDPALKRPGRLEKCLTLGYPDERARLQIVLSNLNGDIEGKDSVVSQESIEEITSQTKGMAGASIVAACNDLRMLLACGTYHISSSQVQDCIQRRRSNNT